MSEKVIMKTYAKGARSERELLKFLDYKGFSCVRSASSGGFFSPVDIVATKKGFIIAIECKAWSTKPKLKKEKLREFKKWCERAGAKGFLAWYNNAKWKFLRIEDAEKNKYEDENWFSLNDFLRLIDLYG